MNVGAMQCGGRLGAWGSGRLLERQAVRARRADAQCLVEVHLEPRVQFELITFQVSHMHDVITLRVHLPRRVLVEEVSLTTRRSSSVSRR